MRYPILLTGLAAMLLSFLVGINFILFITVAATFVISFIVIYFLKERRLHFIFAAFLLCAIITATAFNFFAVKRVSAYKEETVKITAVITESHAYNGMKYSYEANLKTLNNEKTNFTKIRLNCEKENFAVGDLVEARVTLFEYDNKKSSYADNIYMGSTLKEIIRVKQNHTGIRYKIFKLQKYTKTTVENYLDGDIGQLLVAVITGDRSGITDETYSLIKLSGVAHMIVVSGMHLSIVCTALMLLINKTVVNRYTQTIVMLIAIFFIMFFCGFTKSVLRAGITYIILAIAPLLKRDRDSLSALAFTVILVVLISPFAFYSVSFQLTLSSTFGILVLCPAISQKANRMLHTHNIKFIKNLIDILSVTIAANIMTLPIVLYIYEWVSVVSLATNILINYCVSTILVVGIIGVILGKITFIAYPCFFVSGLLSKYSLWVIKSLGSLPFAIVSFNGKPLAAIVCMIYFLVFLYHSLIKNSHHKKQP